MIPIVGIGLVVAGGAIAWLFSPMAYASRPIRIKRPARPRRAGD